MREKGFFSRANKVRQISRRDFDAYKRVKKLMFSRSRNFSKFPKSRDLMTFILHFISTREKVFFSCAHKMRQISRRDFEAYEGVKKFMGKNKLDEEVLRKYINHEVHLKVSSEDMEPSTFSSMSDASMFLVVSRNSQVHS